MTRFAEQSGQQGGLCQHCSKPEDAHTGEERSCPSRAKPPAPQLPQGPTPTGSGFQLDWQLLDALTEALLPALKEQLVTGSREPAPRPSRVPTPAHVSFASPLHRDAIFSEEPDSDTLEEQSWTAPPSSAQPRCFLPPQVVSHTPAVFDPDNRVSRSLQANNPGAYHEYLALYSLTAYLEEALVVAEEDPAACVDVVRQVIHGINHPRLDYLQVLALKDKAAARYVAGQTALSTESQLFSPVARQALRRYEARELSQLLPRASGSGVSNGQATRQQRGGGGGSGGGQSFSGVRGQSSSSSSSSSPSQRQQQQQPQRGSAGGGGGGGSGAEARGRSSSRAGRN